MEPNRMYMVSKWCRLIPFILLPSDSDSVCFCFAVFAIASQDKWLCWGLLPQGMYWQETYAIFLSFRSSTDHSMQSKRQKNYPLRGHRSTCSAPPTDVTFRRFAPCSEASVMSADPPKTVRRNRKGSKADDFCGWEPLGFDKVRFISHLSTYFDSFYADAGPLSRTTIYTTRD